MFGGKFYLRKTILRNASPFTSLVCWRFGEGLENKGDGSENLRFRDAQMWRFCFANQILPKKKIKHFMFLQLWPQAMLVHAVAILKMNNNE